MIASRRDLERQLIDLYGSDLGTFVTDLCERLGKEMYFEVIKGGQGSPYEVVVSQGLAPNDESGDSILKRARMLYQNATIPQERKTALKSLAELTGAYGRIFVNGSGDMFDLELRRLTDALRKCCELLGQNPDEHISISV